MMAHSSHILTPDDFGSLVQEFYMVLLGAEGDEPALTYNSSSSFDSRDNSETTTHHNDTSNSKNGKKSKRNIKLLIQKINYLEDTLLYSDRTVSSTEESNKPKHCDAVTPDKAVILEIVRDCQRKCAAAIRSFYSEQVRILIFTCNKQLSLKTKTSSSLGANVVTGEHSQRHLNAMLELLGSWSNVLAELLAQDVSDSVLAQAVAPLHTRVSETAISCFQNFKDDKNLDQWYRKVAPGSGNGNTEINNIVPVSLVSLDYILSQLVAMRGIVLQYQFFLAETCDLHELAEDSSMNSWRELDACYMTLEGVYLNYAVSEALQLSACSSSSETSHRLPWQQLLEIQESVFSLQVVEDFFFVIQKVIDRSLQTNTESSIFSICNQVVELIGQSASEEIGRGGGGENLRSVHAILSCRRKFQGISVESVEGLMEAAHTDSRSLEHDDIDDGGSKETREIGDDEQLDVYAVTSALGENLAKSTLALADSLTSGYAGSWFSSISSPLSTGTSFFNVLGSATQILEGEESSQSPQDNVVNNNKSNNNYETPLQQDRSGMQRTPYSKSKEQVDFSNLQQAFLNALELDSQNEDSSDLYGEATRERSDDNVSLSMQDQAVLINSLTTAVVSVQSVRDTMIQASSGSSSSNGNTENNNGNSNFLKHITSSLSIIVQEFDRCMILYDCLLIQEINLLERKYLLGPIEDAVRKLLLVSPAQRIATSRVRVLSNNFNVYIMSGDEVDEVQKDLSSTNSLVSCIRLLFGIHDSSQSAPLSGGGGGRGGQNDKMSLSVVAATGSESVWKLGLSREALLRVIACVATTINDGVMNYILGTTVDAAVLDSEGEDRDERSEVQGMRFNEWGAFLLYDYLTQVIDTLENIAMTDCDASIRHHFLQLIWTMKILTLDQPADLKRCHVPFEKANLIVKNSNSNSSSSSDGRGEGNVVKCILARRSDFSRDAISRMTINIC